MRSTLTTTGAPVYVAFTNYEATPGDQPPTIKNTLFINPLNQPPLEEVDASILTGTIPMEILPAEITTGEIAPERTPYAEKITNKTSVIGVGSTDDQYPSASAVYSLVASISGNSAEGVELISNKVTEVTPLSTDAKYPSAKAVNSAIYSAIQEVTELIPTGVELVSNKVTEIVPGLTDDQYMSAKLLQGVLTQIENSIPMEPELKENKVVEILATATDDEYPSAKAVYTELAERDPILSAKANSVDVVMKTGSTMTGLLTLNGASDTLNTNLLEFRKLDGTTSYGGMRVGSSNKMAIVDEIGKSKLYGPYTANSGFKDYYLPTLSTAASATLLTTRTDSNYALGAVSNQVGCTLPSYPVIWYGSVFGAFRVSTDAAFAVVKTLVTGSFDVALPVPVATGDTITVPAAYTGVIVDGKLRISWLNGSTGTDANVTFTINCQMRESLPNKITVIDASSTDTQYPSAKSVYTNLNLKECYSNKVTSVSGASTDVQYPSAKALYTSVSGKEDAANKVTSISSSSTNVQYPSAKCVYDAISNGVGTLGGELVTNKVTAVNLQSTDAKYPSALAVSKYVNDVKNYPSKATFEILGTATDAAKGFPTRATCDIAECTITVPGFTFTGNDASFDYKYNLWVNKELISYPDTSGVFTIFVEFNALHYQLNVAVGPMTVGEVTFRVARSFIQQLIDSSSLTFLPIPTEMTANKIDSVYGPLTDTQYPTAEAVYDIVNEQLTVNNICAITISQPGTANPKIPASLQASYNRKTRNFTVPTFSVQPMTPNNALSYDVPFHAQQVVVINQPTNTANLVFELRYNETTNKTGLYMPVPSVLTEVVIIPSFTIVLNSINGELVFPRTIDSLEVSSFKTKAVPAVINGGFNSAQYPSVVGMINYGLTFSTPVIFREQLTKAALLEFGNPLPNDLYPETISALVIYSPVMSSFNHISSDMINATRTIIITIPSGAFTSLQKTKYLLPGTFYHSACSRNLGRIKNELSLERYDENCYIRQEKDTFDPDNQWVYAQCGTTKPESELILRHSVIVECTVTPAFFLQ